MRTSDVILSIGLLGLAFGLSPAVSFDGTRTPEGASRRAGAGASRSLPAAMRSAMRRRSRRAGRAAHHAAVAAD